MRLTKIISIILLFYNSLSCGNQTNQLPHINSSIPQINHASHPILSISPQISLPIGIKIWFNECGGNEIGLTSWNDGENFASVGIGHFIWHPYPSKQASYHYGFPKLLRYIESRGIKLPPELRGKKALYCPWSNRTEFLQEKYSPKMVALRSFLRSTIPVQAEYLTVDLQKTLPALLACAPTKDRRFIYEKFCNLAQTPGGIYALVDYLNFKGPGISNSHFNYEHGSGLLHDLKGLKHAPPGLTQLQAYVWSAKHALIRRVNCSSTQNRERWLAGWFKRLNTYLEGDLERIRI